MKKKTLLTVLFASLMGLAFGGCSLLPSTSDSSTSDDSANVSSSNTSSEDSSSVHEHDYASTWTYDDANHWKECKDSTCSDVTDFAAHVFDDGEVTTEPTCDKDGVKTFTCECGYQKTEPIAKTNAHVAATDWSKDEEYHWHDCTNADCKKHLDEAEHSWTDGTKKEDGKWYVSCSECSYEKEDAQAFNYRLFDNKVVFGAGKYSLSYNDVELTPTDGVYDLSALITGLTESTDVELTMKRYLPDSNVGEEQTLTWTSPAVGKELNNFGSKAGVDAFKAAQGNAEAEVLTSKTDVNGVTKNGVVGIDFTGWQWPNLYFGDPIATQPESEYTHIVFTLYFENSSAARIEMVQDNMNVGSMSIIDGWYDYWVPVDIVDFGSFDTFFMMPQSVQVNVEMSGKMYVDGIRFEKAPDVVTGDDVVNTYTTIGDALAGGYNTYYESKTDNKDVTKHGVVLFDIDKNQERTWPNIPLGTPLCDEPAEGTYKYVVFTLYFENSNAQRIAVSKDGKEGELASINIVEGWHDYWIPYEIIDHEFNLMHVMPQVMSGTPTMTGKVWIDSIRYEKEAYATISDDGILTVGTQNTYEVVANDQVLTAEADGTYDLKKLRPEGVMEAYDVVVTVIRKVDGEEFAHVTYTWTASMADYELNCVGSQSAFDRMNAVNYFQGVYNAEKADANGVTKQGVYSVDLLLQNSPWPNIRIGVPFCSAEDYAKYDEVIITYYLEGSNANVFKVFTQGCANSGNYPDGGIVNGWTEYRISTKDLPYENIPYLILFPYASEAIVNGTLHIDSVKLGYGVTATQENGILTVGDGEYSVFYNGQSVSPESNGTYDLTKLVEDDGNGFTIEVTVNRIVGGEIVATKIITVHKEGTRDQSVLNNFDNAWEAEKAGYTTFADEVTDQYGVTKTGVVSTQLSSPWPHVYFGEPLCKAPAEGAYKYVVVTMWIKDCNANRILLARDGMDGSTPISIVKGWNEYWISLDVEFTKFDGFENFFFMPYADEYEVSGTVYIDSVRFDNEEYATINESGILTVGTQYTYEVKHGEQTLTAEADGTYDLKKLRTAEAPESQNTDIVVIRKENDVEIGRKTYTWCGSVADYEINCMGSMESLKRMHAANYGFGVYNAEKADANGVTKQGVYSVDLSLFNTPWPNVRLGVPFCSAEDYAKYDTIVITYCIENSNANVFKVFTQGCSDAAANKEYPNSGIVTGWTEYRISTSDLAYENIPNLILFPYASEAVVNGTLYIDSVKLEKAE